MFEKEYGDWDNKNNSPKNTSNESFMKKDDKMDKNSEKQQLEEIKSQLNEIDSKLSNTLAKGFSENDLISIEINGRYEIINISIDDSLPILKIEKGILDAFKEAHKKVKMKSLQNLMNPS